MIQPVDDTEPAGSESPKPKFPLGRLVATPGVLVVIPNAEIQHALRRHRIGDWGDLDDEDVCMNELGLKGGLRLLSQYRTASGVKFWIITEADRSVTTVLLPEEY